MKTVEVKEYKYEVGDLVQAVDLPEKNYEGLVVGKTYLMCGASTHDGNVIFAIKDQDTGHMLYSMDHFEKVGRVSAPPEERVDDPVNHPSHYNQGGLETLQIIEMSLSPFEFMGYLKGNVIKYRERAQFKGKAEQDYAKAKWYFNKLQEYKEKVSRI